ncbi:MAG: tetratricopeptide repeat protein [Ignavibacteriaceae bacterium]
MAQINRGLERILAKYFGEGEISKYKKLLSESISKKEGITETASKKQVAQKISHVEKYQLTIDLIITFAKEKLTRNKFIEMLLHLGDISISLGEHSAASNLFLYIVTEIKDEPDFENLKAHSFLSLGDIYSRQANWKKSIKYIKQAQKIFIKYKDLKGIAKCDNLIGTIEGEKGNLKRAKTRFEKSVSQLDIKKDNTLMGMLEINLGVLNNIQGNYDLALTYYQRALIRFEQMGDNRRLVEIRHNLGMLFSQKEEYEAALSEFDKSISLAMNLGYTPTLGLSYLSKAFIYTRLHDYLLAGAFADKAMEVCDRLNDRLSIADIYKIKGIIERSLQNYESAENYFLSSLRINQDLENSLNEAESYFELGLLYMEINNLKEAHKALIASLKYYKKTGVLDMVKRIESLLWFSN